MTLTSQVSIRSSSVPETDQFDGHLSCSCTLTIWHRCHKIWPTERERDGERERERETVYLKPLALEQTVVLTVGWHILTLYTFGIQYIIVSKFEIYYVYLETFMNMYTFYMHYLWHIPEILPYICWFIDKPLSFRPSSVDFGN